MPVQVIAHVLNLPEERGADIKRWSDDATSSIGADVSDARRLEAQRGMLELQHFMHEQFELRRHEPRDDILTTLVQSELPVDGDDGATRPLNEPELLGILQQLIGAGNETTTKLINEMVRLLGEHHDEWWTTKADASRIPAVVEETLRLAEPDAGDLPRRRHRHGARWRRHPRGRPARTRLRRSEPGSVGVPRPRSVRPWPAERT